MEVPAQETTQPHDPHNEHVDFSKGAADPDIDMFFPDREDEDADMPEVPDSDEMMSSLLAAGTNHDAAQLFINQIYNKGPPSFMEMYGQGSIVAEANRSRRFLNIQGLNAFDLRTVKPDGQPWNFNVRADRRLARDMISAQDPDWIIGSPPRTAFYIWNRLLNNRKMLIENVLEAIAEGERHLKCCCSLCRFG